MRILYVLTSLDVGGIEKNQVRLSHELVRRGHEVTVVSSGGALMPDLVAAGVRHIRAPVAWRSGTGLLAAALGIRRLLMNESFTVVHAMSASANVATFLARRQRRPWTYVTSPMGLQNSDREPLAVTRLRNVLIAAGADWVLAISPQIRAGLRSVGVPSRRIVDCDLVGLEDRFFDLSTELRHRERVRLGLSEGDSLVTTIGALQSRKSHDKFVRMAARLSKLRPRSRFIVVGEGPERHSLEDLARELGVADRLSFPGQIADVRPLLEATDVYIKPGIVEGFVGITVLEAMALSRPVAAFDTRDVRLVIEDGKTGALAPSGDERALAAKVDELLTDSARASQMASSGRAVVERRFRIGRIVSGLEEIYGRLVDDDSRARTMSNRNHH